MGYNLVSRGDVLWRLGRFGEARDPSGPGDRYRRQTGSEAEATLGRSQLALLK